MSTETTTETREFIIVGQDQGSSYLLWDVAPAPTDATKRAMALEEIEIDAHDAFGSVHLEHATSARAAVDQLLSALREQSGLDDYPLSPASQLESYQADPDPNAATEPEPYGKAHALSATRDAGYQVNASSVPGTATFIVDGLPVRSTTSTRDRVRAGVINSGLDWPMSNVLVKIAPTGTDGDDATSVGTSGLDLAIACSVLAAASTSSPVIAWPESPWSVNSASTAGCVFRSACPARSVRSLMAARRPSSSPTTPWTTRPPRVSGRSGSARSTRPWLCSPVTGTTPRAAPTASPARWLLTSRAPRPACARPAPPRPDRGRRAGLAQAPPGICPPSPARDRRTAPP